MKIGKKTRGRGAKKNRVEEEIEPANEQQSTDISARLRERFRRRPPVDVIRAH